jgi:hypothetical protein
VIGTHEIILVDHRQGWRNPAEKDVDKMVADLAWREPKSAPSLEDAELQRVQVEWGWSESYGAGHESGLAGMWRLKVRGWTLEPGGVAKWKAGAGAVRSGSSAYARLEN